MTFLPIVDRELTVAARKPGTYWGRFWMALLALSVWFLILGFARRDLPGQLGHVMFQGLAMLGLSFSISAFFMTADCIASEKREGTLGLLFLTDLKAYDVVLGKLVATSLSMFFGLLAVLPILGLPLLMGGVTGSEFWRMVLVFVTTMFWSLGIGMFASAISRGTRQALTRAILLVIVFAGICPALWWCQRLTLNSSNFDFLLWPSPVYAYLKASYAPRIYFGSLFQGYWGSLATIFGIGLGCIALAVVILPRVWQQKVEVEKKSRKRPAQTAAKLARRARLLAWNPMYWLSVRDSTPARMAVKALLLLVTLFVVMLLISVAGITTGHAAFITCMIVAYASHLVIKLLVAVEASRRLNDDCQSGALELLLATPVSPREILRGQKQALFTHFKGALAVLTMINLVLCFCVIVFSKELDTGGREQGLFLEMFLGGLLALWLDFEALGWLGMWRGLTTVKHHRAVLMTFLSIMGLPWLAFFLLMIIQPRLNGQSGPALVMGILFSIGIAADLFFGLLARQKLRTGFRGLAAQRFHGKTG